jgi:hypothetical protein
MIKSKIAEHVLFCTYLLCPLVAMLICGCNLKDSPSGSFRVTRLSALDHTVREGDDTRLDIYFSTKTHFTSRHVTAPLDVFVLVSIPPGLEYVPSSGRIYLGNALVDSFRREPDIKENCPNGSSFIAFKIKSDELEPRGPAGDGSNQKLRIQVRALNLPGIYTVESSAGPSEAFSCLKRFTGERNAQFVIE